MPKPTGRPRVTKTLHHELYRLARLDLDKLTSQAWPAVQWRDDPVGFVKHVLREDLAPHQAAILEATVKHEKVAVRSGTKNGKTKTIIWLALWWYATRPGARVIMTAAIGDQIKRVLWNELENTIGIARRGGLQIERPGKSPASGLVSLDGRQIIGFTARDIEAVAGISGPEMLFIVDEASALKQNFAEAIEGNMAGGGCRMVYISNPVRTDGPFFDAFHSKRGQFATFNLDAEKVAEWNEARAVPIRGLVTQRKIDQWREEYGETSVFYRVRVKGEFVENETGKIIDLATLSEAQNRENSDDGQLSIGIDPAGPGDGGDDTAFAIVRGKKQIGMYAFRSLTEDAIVAHARGFVAQYRRAGELPPRIIIDSEGPIGSALTGKMRGIADVLRRSRPQESYECYGVKASMPARRKPQLYDMARDELWANLAEWLKEGTIIPDFQLEAELHAPNWESTLKGKLRATHKNKLRDMLGRSPDRADALALAVWEPAPWLIGAQSARDDNEVDLDAEDEKMTGRRPGHRDIDPYERPFDPYAR